MTSFEQCRTILHHFANGGPPIASATFKEMAAQIEPGHFEDLEQYLELGKDGLVRPRSLAKLKHWQQWDQNQRRANWAALGIAA